MRLLNLSLLHAKPDAVSLIAEGIVRIILWAIFIFGLERMNDTFMRHAVSTATLYYVCQFLFVTLFWIIARQFTKNDLTFDLQELYFWDMLIQVAGLCLYKAGIDSKIFVAASMAIWLIKTGRLLWFARSSENKLEYIGWPTFGFLGLIRTRKGQRQRVNGSAAQNALVYAFIIATVPAAICINSFGTLDVSIQFYAAPIGLCIIFGCLVVNRLMQFRERFAEMFEELNQVRRSNALLAEKCANAHAVACKLKAGLTDQELSFIRIYLSIPNNDRPTLERIAVGLQADNDPPPAAADGNGGVKLAWQNPQQSNLPQMRPDGGRMTLVK